MSERLGPWILLDKLGSGGLADVWRARPSDGDRTVALKVLREPDRSVAHRARFLREGRLLQRLEHPGLARCFGVVEQPRPYLVLEELHGETLSQRLKRSGRLDSDSVLALASSILRVLEHLHQQGIVHRDVKSSNIYLEDSRRVLLLDLGLAVDPTDPLTTTLGDVMGTYAYMAPEQIAGAEVDHRCDLYSLGITLYEALAGSRPFQASGAAGYLRAHRRGQATPLSELVEDAPIRLLDAVARLMARDPAVRPPSASVALARLLGTTGSERRLRPAPLAGRAAALGAVQAVLDGGGRVFLRGEIGSGGGRLAAEALRLAREEGHEILAVRCRNRSTPMDPVDQLCRDLSAISGPVEPDSAALGRALEALSAEGPTLLLIEDAEQLSAGAARVLTEALGRAPRLGVIITGLTKPPGIEAHRVTLRPLNVDETSCIVAGMLGTASPPAGLAGRLHRLSGGLPAIVVLGIKDLVNRQALICEGLSDDGTLRWRLDRNAHLAPAAGLDHLFGEVLQSLGNGPRQLLDVLAVAGEALPLDLALRLAQQGDDMSGLGVLRRARLVRQDAHHDGDWISLRRPALGSLVLTEVSAARRSAMHRAIGQALEALESSTWRDRRLAWHRAFGAHPDEAAQSLLELGEDLNDSGEPGKALEVLSEASRIPGARAEVAAQLAVARGEALDTAARRTEAVDAFSAGRRLAEELGDIRLQTRAIVGLAHAHHCLGDERRTALLAEEVLELSAQDPEDPSLPVALLLAATAHRLGARPEQAAATYKECIELSSERGRLSYAARAHGGLGSLLGEEGQLEEAVRHFHEEASYLRSESASPELVPCLYRLSICERRRGHPQEALVALDEAADVARFAQLPYAEALAHIGRAAVFMTCGDYHRARSLLDGARIARDPEASTYLRLAYTHTRARLRLLTGDRQAALAAFQEAEMEATRAGFTAAAAYYLGMVGVLTADPDALVDAMHVLSLAGDRSLAASLLFHGATVGGDADVLASTERETRASGDRFLLLDVLHASRGSRAKLEAKAIAESILAHTPDWLHVAFLRLPAVKWAAPDH